MNDPPESSRVEEPIVETQEIPRRSGRTRHEPERYEFLVSNEDDVTLIDDEPTSYKEAITSPDSDKWQGAMKAEIESMYDNQVWNLIDPPEGIKTIGCKWVFKK